MSEKFEKILMGFKTHSEIEYFDNDDFFGFEISWSEKGRGFGSYTFSISKETGIFKIDNEYDGPKAVKRIIDNLINNNKESIRKMFYKMIDDTR